MDADAIIARFAGMALSRGVPSAEVCAAVERLQMLAQRGRPVEIELHGLRVRLPGRTDRQAPRSRLHRETRA